MSLAYRLNKRVLLQRQVDTQDAAGQPVLDWVNVVATGDGKLWAEVRDISGREFLSAGAEQSQVQTRIVIRGREGIDAGMRVLHGADEYQIVAPLRRSDGTLHLMCSRRRA
jgi:SPP1 family predicted phage head-tail adaptor